MNLIFQLIINISETNVEIKQNYLECVNINSEVYKLVADLNLISSENCETLYRFPPSQITYQVAFKNGSSSEIGIKIELQQSEISSGDQYLDY